MACFLLGNDEVGRPETGDGPSTEFILSDDEVRGEGLRTGDRGLKSGNGSLVVEFIYPQNSSREVYIKGFPMVFLKGLVRNLLFLIFIGFVLYLLFPEQMTQVFDLYGAVFGPILILILIVVAIPKKKNK